MARQNTFCAARTARPQLRERITVVFTVAEGNLEVLSQIRHGGALTVEAWSSDEQTTLDTGGTLTATDYQIDRACERPVRFACY